MNLRIHYVAAVLICSISFLPALHAQLELNCAHDSTGLIPLTDMGTTKYGPFRGGLYPNFMVDMPESHLNKGKALSNAMVPLDGEGNVDWESGSLLVIGMGGSTASNAYNTMVDTLREWDYVGINPCMKLKGLFYGGKDLTVMIDTTSTDYWDYLQEKIDARGETWDNIQVVWMQTHSELPIFDSILYIKTMVEQYTTLLQRIQDSMANVKQVYLTGFHYTGYTHPSHDLYDALAEPKAYWGNLAIKVLIERQIAGDPALAFEGPNKKVPWIAWGPYWWADGTNPRAYDGLTWSCEEYRDDDTGGGFHLDDIGKAKEALMFIDFLATNEVTGKWYLDGAAWINCPEDVRKGQSHHASADIQAYPNPADAWITIGMPKEASGNVFCTLASMNGQVVMTDYISLQDTHEFYVSTQTYPNGMYQLTIVHPEGIYSTKIMVQH